MSTRCHVIFVDWLTYLDTRRTRCDAYITYVHSDGYPDTDAGILARLVRFNKWLREDKYWGMRFDAEYMSANWVYWCKRQKEKGSGLTLGYGFSGVVFDFDIDSPISDGDGSKYIPLEKLEPYLHGDVEYLYFVYRSHDQNDPMNWYVIVANYNGYIIEEGSLKELVSQFVTV